jgi:hypothetical protein
VNEIQNRTNKLTITLCLSSEIWEIENITFDGKTEINTESNKWKSFINVSPKYSIKLIIPFFVILIQKLFM